jgi:hypothetical protein
MLRGMRYTLFIQFASFKKSNNEVKGRGGGVDQNRGGYFLQLFLLYYKRCGEKAAVRGPDTERARHRNSRAFFSSTPPARGARHEHKEQQSQHFIFGSFVHYLLLLRLLYHSLHHEQC